MRQLDEHPTRTLGGLLALCLALFLASGIPGLKDATSGGLFVLGELAWFGFLLTALLFVIGGLIPLVRLARRARRAA
jgi:hypothetical protein